VGGLMGWWSVGAVGIWAFSLSNTNQPSHPAAVATARANLNVFS